MSKKVTGPCVQQEAIVRFLRSTENDRNYILSNSLTIKHRNVPYSGDVWYVMPHLIVERYTDIFGKEHIQPLKSFNRYLLQAHEVAETLVYIHDDPDMPGLQKKALEIFN